MSSLSTIERFVVAGDAAVARLLHPAFESRPLAEPELLQVVDSLARSYRDDANLTNLIRLTGLDKGHRPRAGRAKVGKERRFRCLLSTATFEAWLIVWGRSSLLQLHDHGGSSGAVQVLQGQLEETYTDLCSSASLTTRRLGAGDRFSFGADHVHELGNHSSLRAISLHVYSPRLTLMNFYDTGSAFLRPVRSERYQ